MYAVMRSGGKQYRVAPGQKVRLEKLEVEAGQKVELSEVLMVSTGEKVSMGAPYLKGAKVVAEVLAHGRAPKVTTIKFRRRKNYIRKQGHRQLFTEVVIKEIVAA